MARGRVRRSGRVVACLLIATALVSPAAAAPSAVAAGSGRAPSRNAQQQLRDQLAESTDAMVAAATALRRAEAALPQARRDVARFRVALAAAQRREGGA